MLDASVEILMQTWIGLVHNQVDRKTRIRNTLEFVFDKGKPFVKPFGRALVERWKAAYYSCLATGRNDLRAGYEKHRSRNQRELKLFA